MWRCWSSNQEERAAIQADRNIEKMIRDHRKRLRLERRFYMIGEENSGMTTLFRQIRIIHGEGYSDQDRGGFTRTVFQNLFTAMQDLTNAMTTLNIPYANPENQLYSQWIQDVKPQQVSTLEARHADAIRRLWSDAGIRACYSRRREFKLLDSTEYYMDDLDRIAAPGYIPTDQDILRAKTSLRGLEECAFDMGQHCFSRIYRYTPVTRRSILHRVIVSVDFLLFVASLSQYDQFESSDDFENLLRMNLNLFKLIINNRLYRSMPVILFLNKKDILAEKIQTSHLQTYFPEFTGKQGDAEAAMDFIRGLFQSIVIAEGRLVCVHFTCALDPGNIRQAFCDIKDNVLAYVVPRVNEGPQCWGGGGTELS
ncbi:guanine nucleotide-binding protein subunit alpha-14-like isoform X2 [Conger conger]|uniref:guanine nucleotide-binding protein subunit alpha-14-like isoform X2 n=1 Tax=Conger conger TaxID=82655 RepID=UPI002A5AA9C2|nr:guanine nucleotide-binding protein subunit alpha-14-like isoform X2 [Conger conger]